MSDKKYSPKEAALAVLKKAQELYNQTTLAKATTGRLGGRSDISGHEKGVHLPVRDLAGKQQGVSTMGTHVRSPSPGYSKDMARIHANVTHREMKDIKPNLDKAEEMPMKGHIKLAKFMGRMEHKRGSQLDKAETGHEKGIHPAKGHAKGNKSTPENKTSQGSSMFGNPKNDQNAQALDEHNEVLKEIRSMPKPKLP